MDGVVYNFVDPFDRLVESKGHRIDRRFYNRGLEQEQVLKYLKEFGEMRPFKWIPTFEGAPEEVRELNEDLDFSIVTHRAWYSEGRNDTLYRLWLDDIPANQIIFSRHKDKWSKILDLDYFIEDVKENANAIANLTRCQVFLINRDYNKGKTANGIIRVNSIREVKDYLNNNI